MNDPWPFILQHAAGSRSALHEVPRLAKVWFVASNLCGELECPGPPRQMGGTAWGKGPHCAPTLGYHHQQDAFILELEEQYVQWALLPACIHPNPFPGGIHSAPTPSELDAGMLGVMADPVAPSPKWGVRTPCKDTLANEGGQGLPGTWLLETQPPAA